MYKFFDKVSALLLLITLTTVILNNLYLYNVGEYQITSKNQSEAQRVMMQFLEMYDLPKIVKNINNGEAGKMLEEFLAKNGLQDTVYIKIESGDIVVATNNPKLKNKASCRLTFLLEKKLVIEVWVGERS